MKNVDILAIAAHPDDVELSCSGFIHKAIRKGQSVGICDLTQGELGTRGSAELRMKEAEEARKILGVSFRENLGMQDGFFESTEANLLSLIRVIRAARPNLVLLNALSDRHPDHGRGAELEKRACFLSGLRRIETSVKGMQQEAWRPKLVLHCIQDYQMTPDIVIDISENWEKKMESIMAFGSQFYDPKSEEPKSAISGKDFLKTIKGRARDMGRYVSAEYGEGFVCERPLGVEDLKMLS